jgi:hypothetical protein
MTEKLDFPVEKFKQPNILTDNAGGKVAILVII